MQTPRPAWILGTGRGPVKNTEWPLQLFRDFMGTSDRDSSIPTGLNARVQNELVQRGFTRQALRVDLDIACSLGGSLVTEF